MTAVPGTRSGFRSVKAQILKRITAGDWGPGASLPGEIELARQFGVARATINRAMRELDDEGILDRKRKAGTKVRTSPLREARFAIPLIRAEIEASGAHYGYRLLHRERVALPEWLAARFGATGAGMTEWPGPALLVPGRRAKPEASPRPDLRTLPHAPPMRPTPESHPVPVHPVPGHPAPVHPVPVRHVPGRHVPGRQARPDLHSSDAVKALPDDPFYPPAPQPAPQPPLQPAPKTVVSERGALYLLCLHLADDVRYQLEERWINLEALPQALDADFTDRGPNDWLVSEVPFSDVEISFLATAATVPQATHLRLAIGAPVFTAERTTWWQGQPLTHVRLSFASGYRMTTRY